MKLSICQHLEQQTSHHPRLRKTIRITAAVIAISTKSQLRLFANALTFHTLLAIVPLLAILFILLKSFGIDSFLNNAISDVLAPMGAAGKDVADYLYQFINNAQSGFLGGAGLIFLLYSVFGLFNKIEQALNDLWHINTVRPLITRISGYLSLLMVVVILASATLALKIILYQGLVSQTWTQSPWAALALEYLLKALSVLITATLLAAIYKSALNTPVRFRAALIGGLYCSLLWIPLTKGFAALMSASSSYSVIYSSFAGLVILLVWLNIVWLLLLSGSLVSYFSQNPSLIKSYAYRELNPTEMEHYALVIISLIIARFKDCNGPTTLKTLITESRLSQQQIDNLLEPFIQQRLIMSISEGPSAFLPAVHPDQLTNEVILDTIRGKLQPR